jgi:Zn-finger nucleic acid-binding protein
MTCPRCSSDLEPKQRDGVEIDRCTRCGGIWLDAGEMERLVGQEQAYYGDDRARDRGRDRDDDDDDFGGGAGRGGRQGRGGFFQNLMDSLGGGD